MCNRVLDWRAAQLYAHKMSVRFELFVLIIKYKVGHVRNIVGYVLKMALLTEKPTMYDV